MPSEAEAYLAAALEVAEHTITNRQGAILWWKDEAPHRTKYKLSKDDEMRIAEILGKRFPK